jgi:hypothetical protein
MSALQGSLLSPFSERLGLYESGRIDLRVVDRVISTEKLLAKLEGGRVLMVPNKRTKQEIMDETTDLLGIEHRKVGSGSSEPREFFLDVAAALRIDLPSGGSKPEFARKIAGMGGLVWDQSCDSTSSKSGGGSTVTSTGLERVLDAAKAIKSGRVRVDGEFEFDARPDASALMIFQHMKFSEWYALGEFIDNSITSAHSNFDQLRRINGDDYRLRVEINIDESGDEPKIVVSDNAGGISRANIANAMRTGSMPLDSSAGLSVHGVGMKAAGFWWGTRLEVETYPIDEPNGWRMVIDLDEIRESQNGVGTATKIPNRGFPGTVISVSKLHKGLPRTRTVTTIRKYLPSIYRQFLVSNEFDAGADSRPHLEMELKYQGTPLSYARPELLNEPFWPSSEGPEVGGSSLLWRKEIDIDVETNDGVKKVTGWVGLLKTMSRELSGFFLHFRGKGIAGVVPESDGEGIDDFVARGAYKPRSIFGQSGGYVDQRLVGEIDISEFGKTITTDDVVWSPAEEQDFLDKLTLELLSPDFIRQARSFRAKKKTDKSKKTQEKIVKEETTALAEGIATSGIEHGGASMPPEGAGVKPIDPNEFRNEDADDPVYDFVVSDSELHDHMFKLRILQDRSHVFLDVSEHDHEHLIALNENHPVFEGLGPIEGPIEQLLIRLALGIASSEVFLTSPDKRQARLKLNEMLAKIPFATETVN